MTSTLLTLRSTTRLLKWMGPWAKGNAMPEEVAKREIKIPPQKPGQRPLDAWIYTPKGHPPFGAVFIAPGLFPTGPEDQRLDRISRIFADAGNLVLTPFLPDYMSLRITPTVIEDTDRAYGALLEQPDLPPGIRPGVFAISFGSLPALRLATAPHRAGQVGGMTVWGGYADWRETMHFAFTGEVNGQRLAHYDPTNQPVVFMNIIDRIPGVPVDPELMINAWRKFVLATWSNHDLRPRFKEVAREIAQELPEAGRNIFLIGCGAEPGGYELCTKLLAEAQGGEFLDPRPYLKDLHCPLCLVHVRNDDVIPANQLDRLVAALPPKASFTTYLTGSFEHDGKRGKGGGKLSPAFLREMQSMAGILLNFSRLGLRRGTGNMVDTSRQQTAL
jgi:pimeloyl-ACP methyl ester carboxylesterase